jgi:hypothetical protein
MYDCVLNYLCQLSKILDMPPGKTLNDLNTIFEAKAAQEKIQLN